MAETFINNSLWLLRMRGNKTHYPGYTDKGADTKLVMDAEMYVKGKRYTHR